MRYVNVLLLIFGFTTASLPEWWANAYQNMIVTLRYKEAGVPLVQCTVTQVSFRPLLYLGAGTCLFDDWGNFLGVPESYEIVVNSLLIHKVIRIYVNPSFWFSNTQSNIAIFEADEPKQEMKEAAGPILKIGEHKDLPEDCYYAARNPANKILNITRTEVVDRDRFCFRQQFPLSVRLRYDNICARVPAFGIHRYLERHLAGSPIICGPKLDAKSKDNETLKNKGRLVSTASADEAFIYAILSFNYRCETNERVAVFSKLAYHREFVMDPNSFISHVLLDFNMRQNNIDSGLSSSSSLHWQQLKLIYMCLSYFILLLHTILRV